MDDDDETPPPYRHIATGFTRSISLPCRFPYMVECWMFSPLVAPFSLVALVQGTAIRFGRHSFDQFFFGATRFRSS